MSLEPEQRPPQGEPMPEEAAMAGARAILQIDESDRGWNKALVEAFLCAAWPSLRAQSQ